MTMHLNRLLLAGVSLIAGTIAFAPAQAQSQAQIQGQSGAGAAPAETAVNVDEIVVSARRRDERLQDVPAAVTAFSSATLQNMQAATVGDLQGSVPNLTIHEGDAANAVVYVRGVGQIDSLAFADPGVGVYVDDVYLGRAQGPSSTSTTWTASKCCAARKARSTAATPSAAR